MDLSFSFQNVLDHNGLVISATGMLIVFFALTLISVAITLLPKFLKVLAIYFPEKEEPTPISAKSSNNGAIVAAIAYAVHQNKLTSSK